MRLRLGIGHAPVEEPGVQLLVALELEPRREEPLADVADLVLDLSLLPACRRRAGRQFHQVMAHQLQEAAIERPLLVDEHGIDRRWQAPLKNWNAFSWASNTISCASRG